MEGVETGKGIKVDTLRMLFDDIQDIFCTDFVGLPICQQKDKRLGSHRLFF